MTTVHSFTDLGMRTMPIGHAGLRLVRGEDGKKQIVDRKGKILSFNEVMPANWTQVYGLERTIHKNTPLGGVICGALQDPQEGELEVIALDCDDQAAWDLFTSVHPTYQFRFESVGKPGGTVLYLLPESLVDLPQYSINNGAITFEYMARREAGRNAMVYLPTTANETKQDIPKGAELEEPPEHVVSLIKSLRPRPQAVQQSYEEAPTNLPFNAPLVKQFAADSKEAGKGERFAKFDTTPLAEKVYRIFTPKKFRGVEHYEQHGWVHPNSSELLTVGSWSEYIVGVSAIAGSDPSISPDLYADFMQAINMQVDDPMEAKRFVTEVINPMVTQKAKIHGKPIWKYNEKWDQTSHTIINQYGESLEYYTLENAANRFVEYNHTTKEMIEVQGNRALRDQIYSKDKDPQQEVPSAAIVKKLKLIRIETSVKLPLGVFTDKQGHTILNTAEPCFALRVLREPELIPFEVTEANKHVQAFNLFLSHLVNNDEKAITFMKQVIAYHGKHLDAIPVIMYMVGVGGAGKSHFARMLELLFGSNTTSRPSTKQMTSQYNDFLENTAVLILSETSDSSYRDQEGIKGILKTVTGEKTIDIETKSKPIRRNVPVFALPVLLANEPWYQEDSGDRRLFSIMPKTTLPDSKPVTSFEQAHGIRIIEHIEEGIQLGVISKYLASFCPKTLPAVPLTEDKQQLSLEQKDPVMVVKNAVATGNLYRLFDLMEEYDVELFFTTMESPKVKNKDCIFKNQLVTLVKNIRGMDTFNLTDAAIGKAFSARWMPNKVIQYRPRKDNPLAMRLGYMKWEIGMAKPYEEWKVDKMTGEDL